MSTPNFPRPNCWKYYTIWMNTYNRDDVKREMEMQSDDPNEIYECDVDEHIDFLIECDVNDKENELKDIAEKNWFFARDNWKYERSIEYKKRWDWWWESLYITCVLVIRSWYYDGAIIDWWWSEDDFSLLPKWVQRSIDIINKNLHKEIAKISTEIKCLWVMSNWEAIYQLA